MRILLYDAIRPEAVGSKLYPDLAGGAAGSPLLAQAESTPPPPSHRFAK